MFSKKRMKRGNEFYMKLKDLLSCEYLGNYEKLIIIFSSVLENVTTTQLNQINIALEIKKRETIYTIKHLEQINET